MKNILTQKSENFSIKKLDFKPKTDLKIGLPKFINWYKKYYLD